MENLTLIFWVNIDSMQQQRRIFFVVHRVVLVVSIFLLWKSKRKFISLSFFAFLSSMLQHGTNYTVRDSIGIKTFWQTYDFSVKRFFFDFCLDAMWTMKKLADVWRKKHFECQPIFFNKRDNDEDKKKSCLQIHQRRETCEGLHDIDTRVDKFSEKDKMSFQHENEKQPILFSLSLEFRMIQCRSDSCHSHRQLYFFFVVAVLSPWRSFASVRSYFIEHFIAAGI